MKKSPSMFLIILGSWFLMLAHFNPYILRCLAFQNNPTAKISIAAFVLLIDIFWLYGIYHTAISLFSIFFAKRNMCLPPPLIDMYSKIALFYLTMNDFKEEAALSCVNQDYPNFDIYILDDSTDEGIKTKIDKFIKNLHKKPLLIRRANKKAYKAGNLNYALNKICKDYEYFAVCDADGIIPNDFLRKLIPYFSIDNSIGFVQANQRSNSRQMGIFARNFSFITDIHWKYYVPVREQFGFLMFYGHGAIIKTSVWKEAEGFPETVTEDLAFSSIIREKGYKGIFVPNVVCYEDFPVDYIRFRRRNERWIKGTAEYLLRWYFNLLVSKGVTWAEKFDILLACGNLLLAPPFLMYLFIVGMLLPLSLNYFDLHIPLTIKFFPIVKFHSPWKWDFYFVMISAAMAQLIPLAFKFIKTPLKMLKYVANFTFISIAPSICSFCHIMSYCITKRSFFPVSGSKTMEAESGMIFKMEIILSLILGYAAIYTTNIWLLSIVVTFGVDILFYKFKRQNTILSSLIYAPFVINVLIIIVTGFYLS